jgi:diguanylate cyclase (GGDEF)-like protein/PAS domain S-box-containing protein
MVKCMVAPSFEKLPNDISLDNRELLNFMDLTGVPSFVTDLDGRLVYSNTAGIEMLGLQGGHYFGSSFRDVLHPDDQALAAAQGQELLEGKVSTVSAERRYRHSAGHYIWVSVSVAVARRLDGSPKCITLQAINIDHHKRALLALTESEQRWNFALESAGQGVWEADRSTNTVFYSDTWKKLRGYRPDEQVDSSQAAWISRIHPRDRDRVLATIAKNNEGGSERASFEYRERHKDGHYIWIQSRGAPIAFYPDGSPLRVIGTDTDITELKRAERDGSALSHRLELALDVSGIGVFEADLETGALLFDRRMHDIFGTSSQDELNEEVFNNALHENDAADVLAGIEKAINARGTFSGRFRIRRPDGTVRTVMANSTFFEDTEGVAKFVGANWDITDDVELAERLNSALVLAESRYVEIESAKTLIEHQAFHDALTSLPNRRFLEDLLEKHASQPDGTITVLHIDVDRFKHINDTFGHAAGDALLRHVSAALQRLCEPGDFVARVGGDEFTMVRLGPQDRFSLDMLAERIIQSLRQPMTFAGHEFSCGASLGNC